VFWYYDFTATFFDYQQGTESLLRNYIMHSCSLMNQFSGSHYNIFIKNFYVSTIKINTLND